MCMNGACRRTFRQHPVSVLGDPIGDRLSAVSLSIDGGPFAMTSDSRQILERLAYNLRWAWHRPTTDLFHSMAPEIWDSTHNPIAVMRAMAEAPDGLVAYAELLASAGDDLDNYMSHGPHLPAAPRVAYFSAEFAIAEFLPIYSGGLGVLAGDHLKSASDLGVPTIGVSLFFRQGYFRQYLNQEGWQQEHNPDSEVFHLPLIPELAADGSPLMISVPFPGRELWARVWRVQVG